VCAIVDARPVPVPDPVSLPYWEAAREGRLVVQVCRGCAAAQFPPDLVCHACLGADLAYEESSGAGKLYSYAVYVRSFDPAFEVPYVLALVDLVDRPGVRLMTNIVDTPVDELAVDMPVEVTFEDRGAWRLPQFRAAREPA
jgi:uncharacterized OB-fold protein